MTKANQSFKKWLQDTNKFSLGVFVILWLLSFAALINSLILWDWFKIGLALAALVFYFVPFLAARKFRMRLPAMLEITYYLFIFASLILGEVFAFYGPFPFWDVVLHMLSGFVLAGIGFSIVEIMNKGRANKIFTLLFAFCFSITLGVMWECLEFGFDMTVRTDAQKDAHVREISTITMQRDGGNQPVRVDNIANTDIHLYSGETITVDEGYLDIGLMDTMKDLLVNVAGAGVFCIFGIFGLSDRRKHSFADNFIPTKN